MRMVNGAWQCLYCQAELDVPDGRQPRPMLIGQSGKPNVRVLILDGKEIHRCEIRGVYPSETRPHQELGSN